MGAGKVHTNPHAQIWVPAICTRKPHETCVRKCRQCGAQNSRQMRSKAASRMLRGVAQLIL